MAKLKIVHYPNPILAKKAEPVASAKSVERKFLKGMVEIMYQDDGVGLAAPQVGVSKQIIVISPRAKKGEERILFNPEILEESGEEIGLEGCLSLPGISGEVRRAVQITFQAMDIQGNLIKETVIGFEARVIQHEVDHLNGKVFIDRVDFDTRQRLLNTYMRQLAAS